MLQFLDELKEGYAKADKALGGFLPGGGTGNPLSNTVREGALKTRDAALDILGADLKEELFIKAHTGGQSGDGVIRELPKNVLETIKGQAVRTDRDNFSFKAQEFYQQQIKTHEAYLSMPDKPGMPISKAFHQQELKEAKTKLEKLGPVDKDRKVRGRLSLYGTTVEAEQSLGSIGLYYDKEGNVLIKDKWKVDYDLGKVGDGSLFDLVEGGRAATDIHELARQLGTYRDIPIEVRLTKDQWEAIGEGGSDDMSARLKNVQRTKKANERLDFLDKN